MRSMVATYSRATCSLRTRSLCTVLCALLCVSSACALAEQPTLAISEIRQQTESGWHETYAAYGRTITVDIPIATPDVTALPILRVGFVPKLSDEAAAPLKEGMEFLLWDSVWTH